MVIAPIRTKHNPVLQNDVFRSSKQRIHCLACGVRSGTESNLPKPQASRRLRGATPDWTEAGDAPFGGDGFEELLELLPALALGFELLNDMCAQKDCKNDMEVTIWVSPIVRSPLIPDSGCVRKFFS